MSGQEREDAFRSAGPGDETKNMPPPPEQLTPASAASDETAALPGRGAAEPSGVGSAGLWRELPAQLGRYRLLKLLGKGGMGAVYLAHDTQLDRAVALKIPNLSASDSPELRERFYREARAAAALSHPNLCAVYDVGQVEGVDYLTMAYIDGQPLSATLREGRPLPQEEAAALVRQVALALHEAHQRGIIHRDLKPANILIDRRGQPVVTDFGLARRTLSQADARVTQSGAMLGTPAYMSPEQISGDPQAVGPACDIYSLGVVLYELLAGRPPFQGTLSAVLAGILLAEPPPLAELRCGVHPALAAICRKAMAKSPRDRYPSMAALAAALDEYLHAEAGATLDATSLPDVEFVSEVEPGLPGARQAWEPAVTPVVVAPPCPPAPSLGPLPKRRSSTLRLLLGCSIAGLTVVLLCGGAMSGLVWMLMEATPHVRNWMEKELARNQLLVEMGRSWRPPPADAGPEILFPAQVDGYRLAEHDAQAHVPEFRLEKSGLRAVYRSRGQMELFVYRATALEKEALFRRACEVLQPKESSDPFASNSDDQNTRRACLLHGSASSAYLDYDLPAAPGMAAERGLFWWDQDWLFLARSSTDEDPVVFLKQYLATVSSPPAPPAPQPASAAPPSP